MSEEGASWECVSPPLSGSDNLVLCQVCLFGLLKMWPVSPIHASVKGYGSNRSGSSRLQTPLLGKSFIIHHFLQLLYLKLKKLCLAGKGHGFWTLLFLSITWIKARGRGKGYNTWWHLCWKWNLHKRFKSLELIMRACICIDCRTKLGNEIFPK